MQSTNFYKIYIVTENIFMLNEQLVTQWQG